MDDEKNVKNKLPFSLKVFLKKKKKKVYRACKKEQNKSVSSP